MPEHDASPVGIKFQRLGGDESCAKTCATKLSDCCTWHVFRKIVAAFTCAARAFAQVLAQAPGCAVQAVVDLLTLWRATIRRGIVAAFVTAILFACCGSELVFIGLGEVPIVSGHLDDKLLAVMGTIAIVLTQLSDFMFGTMLTLQSRYHKEGGLEHKPYRRSQKDTPTSLNVCAFLAVALPAARTVYNVHDLACFLAGKPCSTMTNPHTGQQYYRAGCQVADAVFMALNVPTYQLGLVSLCKTAHSRILEAADKWKRRLATAASDPEGQMDTKPFVEEFDAAAKAVGDLNHEYAKTLCGVILVRTSFILVYTTLQLMMGHTTSSWVYSVVPALEMLSLLGAAATVTEKHHLLIQHANTAAFGEDDGGHGAPSGGRTVGRAAPQYMACADRLAKHVTAHRSKLSVRVDTPLIMVTRSNVLRLTVGIGTSLLTLLIKDIIEANLHLAGIQFPQSNFTAAIPIVA